MSVDLSVVIINHNNNQYLLALLQSIPPAASGLNFEVIIVDNASTTLGTLQDFFPKVGWIKNSENLGWGKAVNKAVKASHGDIIVLLNPDTELKPGSLAEVSRFF